MLRLKVSMKPNQQHDDANANERRAERFAQMAQVRLRSMLLLVLARGVGERGVEAEELGYGYADGGEGEGGAEPG
jgi:hypothetical protein